MQEPSQLMKSRVTLNAKIILLNINFFIKNTA